MTRSEDTPQFRSMRARIGAFESWARIEERAARTLPARRAMLDKFENLAVHQRKAQRRPGEGPARGHHRIVRQSAGRPRSRARGIVGPQHAKRYSRDVGMGDDRGVGHRVGAAGHGQAVPQVLAPSGTTQPIPGMRPRREGER